AMKSTRRWRERASARSCLSQPLVTFAGDGLPRTRPVCCSFGHRLAAWVGVRLAWFLLSGSLNPSRYLLSPRCLAWVRVVTASLVSDEADRIIGTTSRSGVEAGT